METDLEKTARESCIVTHTGIRYTPFDPKQTDVSIIDIAHSLAFQCRYAGHTDFFYSVAEHSVLVSYMVPKAFAFEALLHDAAEAYCQDIAAPIKIWLPDYKAMIEKNEAVIREAFDLPSTESEIVKTVDQLIGRHERTMITKHYVVGSKDREERRIENLDLWDELLYKYPYDLATFKDLPLFQCWSPTEAEAAFLNRFKQLFDQYGQLRKEYQPHGR